MGYVYFCLLRKGQHLCILSCISKAFLPQKLACIKHEMLISAVATGNCRQLWAARGDLSPVGRTLLRRVSGQLRLCALWEERLV